MRDSIRRRGGLAATHELHADGFDRRAIARAVAAGVVLRVRQGWYAEPDIPDELIRAARVGGRATCSTALALHGIWVVRDTALHVAVETDACQLRHSRDRTRRLAADPSDVRVHWTQRAQSEHSRLIVPALTALSDYSYCADPELVGASADVLVHEKPETRRGVQRLALSASPALAGVLAAVDGTSESGTEFLVKWRLRGRLSPGMRPQVHIAGVGRVDFLVGNRLVIEVDSLAYHTDPARFEGDRRRDVALSIRGFRVLRFSYQQVINGWPTVLGAIRAAVARGDAW
jgi:very-short-patch-repair endonuclease